MWFDSRLREVREKEESVRVCGGRCVELIKMTAEA